MYIYAANKYCFAAGHYEKKNFENHQSNLTFGGHNKILNKTSLNNILYVKNINVLVQKLPLHSFIYVSCLVK